MAGLRSIDDLGDLSGRTALLRADLNVPMRDGDVSDDSRIRSIAPTVEVLLARGARVALLSHFGRPKGTVVPEMSLKQILPAVERVLGVPVSFIPSCRGKQAKRAMAESDASVLLLENTRFEPGEDINDLELAADMAGLGDVYINDAFSAAHRAHASTVGITSYLPSAAGLALAAEIEHLEAGLGHPQHPVVAIVGGAKVSTKIGVLENLSRKVDCLIIGGAMANTFLKAEGYPIGGSLHEAEMLDMARKILSTAEKAGCRLLLPVDVVVAKELAPGADCESLPVDTVTDDDMILDFGENSVALILRTLDNARTLVWNGPLGAFEIPPFDTATVEVAQYVADLCEKGDLVAVAGGGDTVAALAAAGVKDKLTHVSTAGGAFLEWMEGRTLPGVAALEANPPAA